MEKNEFKLDILGQNQVYAIRFLTPKINIWHNNQFSIRFGRYSFFVFTCEKDRGKKFNDFPSFNFSGMHNQLVHLISAAQPN